MPNGDVFTGIFEDIHKVEGKQVYSSDGEEEKEDGDAGGTVDGVGEGSLKVLCLN